jgi:hypothetical protein
MLEANLFGSIAQHLHAQREGGWSAEGRLLARVGRAAARTADGRGLGGAPGTLGFGGGAPPHAPPCPDLGLAVALPLQMICTFVSLRCQKLRNYDGEGEGRGMICTPSTFQ